MVWLCKTKIWWKRKVALYGYIKTDTIYKDIAENVEIRFDTSNYELDKPLSKDKNKKVIRWMKDKLDGKIMKKIAGFKAKTYSYLIYNDSEDKTKMCHKKINFENYKNCLEAETQPKNKINHLD